MKNVVVKKSIMPIGIYHGIPCMIVDTRLDKKEAGVDMEIKNIKESLVENTQFNDVLFIGNIPDLKEIIVGMHSLGKNVYVQTDFNDRIDVIRMLKNIRFRLNFNFSDINSKNLVLLKNSDEIIFNIESLTDYEESKKILIAKNVNDPTIIFKVNKKTGYLIILQTYFKDLKTFRFRSRFFII